MSVDYLTFFSSDAVIGEDANRPGEKEEPHMIALRERRSQ
jgi:hypothetical protein